MIAEVMRRVNLKALRIEDAEDDTLIPQFRRWPFRLGAGSDLLPAFL